MESVSITAVIKVKNEAKQIAECMASLVDFATEVIIVNDKSKDETTHIAEQLGARIIDAESKDGMIDVLDKIGFESAKGDWILRLDADERMVPTLAAALKEQAALPSVTGVRFARRNIMFGDWPRYGGWFKNDQLRFFRADAWDRNWSCLPHTHPEIKGSVVSLPVTEQLSTLHLDYDSVPEFVRRTLLGYAATEALEFHKSGRRFSAFRLVFKPLKRFLGRFFIRQGFRDGTRGLVLAMMLAAYDFCIEANLWDLERPRGSDKK